MVILPIAKFDLELIETQDEFEKSERGSAGFGSTGK